MLFATSLVAFVGAGEQPTLTPRKLTLLNTSVGKVIQDINFTSSVLAVKMNRQRLVVVLEKRTFVHCLDTLEHLRTLETSPNPKGICALTSCSEPNYLALPSDNNSGTLRVYDLHTDGGNILCEIGAHKAPLSVTAWNPDGTLLASASNKGTVIRVHRLPQASKVYTFRRGAYPATVYSLCFSPPSVNPPYLCAASSHGTVHVFRLESPDRHPAVVAATAAAGLLSSVVPYSVQDMVDPLRNIATVRLPCQGVPCICAMQASTSQSSAGAGSDREATDAVNLVVATVEGLLYQYSIEDLRNSSGPRCSLEGEWTLLGLPS